MERSSSRAFFASIAALLLIAIRAHASELHTDAPEHVRAGDVLRVHGKTAFARGTRWSFFVGSEYAPWRRVDDDTAAVVVPAEVATGKLWLSSAPSFTSDATAATGIRLLDVLPQATRTTVTARVTLAPGKTNTIGAGPLRVQVRTAKSAPVTLREVCSDADNAFVRSTLLREAEPISFDDVFLFESDGATQVTAIEMDVPEAWLSTLPAALEPALYLYAEDRGADAEVIPGVRRLDGSWTRATRELRAEFTPPLAVAAQQQLTIYLAVRAKESGE
ncbi:MAG TPA: hypothetical protein VFN10_00620 [Thermoanaerobaculia bacterium]|nr:hypothetical protein [Thermoanaerobaculia bacterium]